MAGHIVRFDHRYTQVADAVRLGEAGAPVFLSASRWTTTAFGRRVAGTTTPLWRLLVHDVDLVQWIGVEGIADVFTAVNVESASGQSAFAATGPLRNGATFQLAGGWTLPDGVTAHRAAFELHGTRSHAVIDVWNEGLEISGAAKASVGEDPAQPTVYGSTAAGCGARSITS